MTNTKKIEPQGPPVEEMVRLHKAGFSLLPLGADEDGKAPMVSFKGIDRLPLARVLAPMHRSGSQCYGIRLGGLAVIDCDEDDPELITQMEARFGASPVQVKTLRGRHLYYRAGDKAYPNLRAEGFAVDIKRGINSYVMGPGSVRPDGGKYETVRGDLCENQLHPLKILERPRRTTAPVSTWIKEGERNRALTNVAIALAGVVTSEEELFAALIAARDTRCENPETVPEAEVRKIACWAWRIRCENRLYHDRDSEFRVHRQALDRLKGQSGAEDAIALYIVLSDLHSHSPGKTFALKHEGMRDAGHITISERRFLAARRLLETVGLLQVAAAPVRGTRHQTFRLLRPIELNLDCLQGGERKGEGF